MTAPLPVPDLLAVADDALRIDVDLVRQALTFAFATGSTQEPFDDALAQAKLPASSWKKSGFARDLYVDELVEKSLAVRIGGRAYRTSARYLGRVVAEPPQDSRGVDLRRAVLKDLVTSATSRGETEAIYLTFVRLRHLLCSERQPSQRVRLVEILRTARAVFELCASSFATSTSALARLRDFGAAVVASAGHQRVVAFLDHDEQMASIDLRVRVGADGEVRALDIVKVNENTESPFYVSPWRRFFVRLALFFRGYRTSSDGVVERLLSDVFAGIEDPVIALFQLVGDLELYLGALGFRDRAIEKGLAVSLPTRAAADESLSIEGLFNPLLLAAGMTPVPCNVHAKAGALVVVTGPNSGGKTRLLQAVATTQLLSDAGLFVPARAATVPQASGLFASLYEEARADQPEGHLGMELLRIRRLFDELDAGALVVIDELCSGTNPSEGEEIARLVLSLLPELGVRGFITTHLLEFAGRLAGEASASPLEFLQVELGPGERPTYAFVPGVAVTSLAHRTAARLGVTREELLDRIAQRRRALVRGRGE
jgi:DNA mismatch repair protein MutS2